MSGFSHPSIGIDLGTTHSAVAFLNADGRPETLRSDEGELTTPSVVFFDHSGPIVGREAIKAAEFESERVARYAKRRIGDLRFPKTIQGHRLPPEVIQSVILRKLLDDIRRRFSHADSAVITVPAYFDDARRKATEDAAELAGFQNVHIINEPTAVALAYGVEFGLLGLEDSDREKRSGGLVDSSSASADTVTSDSATSDSATSDSQAQTILVYDLGGGTFDATLIRIKRDSFQTIATDGDIYLGGIDWDRRLVDDLADQFLARYQVDLRDNPSAMERLIQQAESAKRSLSARESTTVRLGSRDAQLTVTLDRNRFEKISADLVERTRMTCCSLIENAGVSWCDVDRVLLAGGSTRMPAIRRMLETASGRPIDRSMAPDEAVAHGAAWFAGYLANGSCSAEIRNVNSHDLGVLGIDKQNGKRRRQLMIEKNSPLPATVTRNFVTSRTGQNGVVVVVVEGGDDSGQYSMPIGKCVINGVPDDLPKGTVIKVTFRYSDDGRLQVNAEIPDIEISARSIIDRAAGLSLAQKQRWKMAIDSGLILDDLKIDDPAQTEMRQTSDLNQASENDQTSKHDQFFKQGQASENCEASDLDQLLEELAASATDQKRSEEQEIGNGDQLSLKNKAHTGMHSMATKVTNASLADPESAGCQLSQESEKKTIGEFESPEKKGQGAAKNSDEPNEKELDERQQFLDSIKF